MTGSRPYDIATIVAMLAARIESLCAELLPAGVREGAEWRCGSVAGEAGRSLGVHLSGARAGVWADFSSVHDRGDALDLVAAVNFRGDKKAALRWSRAWLGIDAMDHRTIAVQRRQAQIKQREQATRDADRAKFAKGMFLQGVPLAGTPSEIYLAGRGIDFRRLGRMPGALRHHRELTHPETGELAPALVAGISDPRGAIVALHRTFLELAPQWHAGEADRLMVRKLSSVQDAKLSLGRYVGGCIRLWRGASGKPMNEAEPGEWAIVGEGIEDVATMVMLKPELRALVAVSLSNMGAMELPPAIAGVHLLQQNDPALNKLGAPHPAREALQRAIDNFQRQGKRVRLIRPPDGVKDVNELLQRGETAA